ncbi:MAG: heme NO-binding protein [Acidimicrobiaceae bacterium]|nr:heme NO-binding protein [Acidimicrobiaceae bacterium]
MKGVIFNAVEDAVEHAFGAGGWDDALGRAEVDGSYTSLGNYDDEELAAIVDALPDKTGSTIPEHLRWVGINCVPSFVEIFPHFFGEITLEDFTPALNHMTHPEVRELHPGATPPDFDISPIDYQAISMRYVSERKLCFLAEGLTIGIASHSGRTRHIDQPSYTHDSDPHCELRIHLPA